MQSPWGSTLVALGLIAGFYFFRKIYGRRKSFFKKKLASEKKGTAPKKGTPLKTSDRHRDTGGAVPIFSKHAERKKKEISKKFNPERPASLLLHPHSLEQAKQEYFARASYFQGLYELLYQGSQGNLGCSIQARLIQDWELKITSTHSEHLTLVWTSIVHHHAGKKFYGKGASGINKSLCSESALLAAWLKQLKDWGVQRSFESGQACWKLNENILEQSSHEVLKSH